MLYVECEPAFDLRFFSAAAFLQVIGIVLFRAMKTHTNE